MAQDDDPRAPYKVFEGDELKGVDAHVAANGPAQFLQPLQECRDTDLIFRIVRRAGEERTDAAYPFTLLRAQPPRPRRRAGNKRDEFAPFHRITSRAGQQVLNRGGARSAPLTDRIAHLSTARDWVRCGISIRLMSPSGHSRRSGDVRVRSAHAPRAATKRTRPLLRVDLAVVWLTKSSITGRNHRALECIAIGDITLTSRLATILAVAA